MNGIDVLSLRKRGTPLYPPLSTRGEGLRGVVGFRGTSIRPTKKWLRYAIVVACVVVCAGVGCADTLEAYFKKANGAYAASRFAEARDLYEKIYAQGLYSKELCYNLSNTYYRLNDCGRAMLYSEKAFRLAPRDNDIRYNRQFLETLTGQQSDTYTLMLGYLSWNELCTLCLVLYVLLFATFVFAWWYTPRWLFFVRLALTTAGIIALCWLGVSYMALYRYPTAVALDADANAYTAPDGNSTVAFTIPVGKKVFVFDDKGEWVTVGVPEKGLKGWMQKEKIGII